MTVSLTLAGQSSSEKSTAKMLALSANQSLIASALQNSLQTRPAIARIIAALAVACALVVAGFVAVSPKAHACVHAHHHAPDHDCFAKHFSDGKVLLTVLAAPVPGLPEIVVAAPAAGSPLFLPFDFRRFPAGRAPPVA